MAVMHNDKSIILLTTMNIFWPTEVTKLVRVLFDQRKYNLNVGALGCGYIISGQHNSWHCACLRVIIFVEGIFVKIFFAAAEPEGASIILFQFFFCELSLCIAYVPVTLVFRTSKGFSALSSNIKAWFLIFKDSVDFLCLSSIILSFKQYFFLWRRRRGSSFSLCTSVFTFVFVVETFLKGLFLWITPCNLPNLRGFCLWGLARI